MTLLSGKVAIVTGAAQGIGRAIAARFAEEGAAVALLDIDRAGEDTAAAIDRAGGKALFVRTDVSAIDDVRTAVESTVDAFGTVSIVVNNAAVFTRGTATTASLDDWDRTMAVNVRAAFLTAKFAVPYMERDRGGVFLNMSSLTGMYAREDHLAYATSKAALLGFTRALAIDHAASNIRAIAVAPSLISNQLDLVARDFDDPEVGRAAAVASHPLKRVASPEELAEFLAFLASDKASYVTGSTYTFDAGYTAGAAVAG